MAKYRPPLENLCLIFWFVLFCFLSMSLSTFGCNGSSGSHTVNEQRKRWLEASEVGIFMCSIPASCSASMATPASPPLPFFWSERMSYSPCFVFLKPSILHAACVGGLDSVCSLQVARIFFDSPCQRPICGHWIFWNDVCDCSRPQIFCCSAWLCSVLSSSEVLLRVSLVYTRGPVPSSFSGAVNWLVRGRLLQVKLSLVTGLLLHIFLFLEHKDLYFYSILSCFSQEEVESRSNLTTMFSFVHQSAMISTQLNVY